MPSHTERRTVDLSAYPDLTVIYLGMRLNRLSGIFQILKFWPQVKRSVEAQPDGLLLHEYVIWGLNPLHLGMRQYWRDFDTLERWAKTAPHQRWWGDFLRASRGAGFWHETYSRRRGIEAVYDDLAEPPGLGQIAPLVPADGPMYSARKRLAQLSEAEATTESRYR